MADYSRVPQRIDRTKRFHTPDYKRRVNAARRYKRERPKVHENPERRETIKKWSWLGLGLIIFAALVYLIYFAPFLQVRSLALSGADGQLAPQVQQQFGQYVGSYHYWLPRKNIVFFSTKAFTANIKKDGLVENVTTDKKVWWHTVKVTVVQRAPTFMVADSDSRLLIADDGYVVSILQPTDPQPTLPMITDYSSDDAAHLPIPSTQELNSAQIHFIDAIQKQLPTQLQIQPVSYEITSRQSEYLTVNTTGFMLMFDMSMDPSIALQRLATIMQQPAQQNRAHIAYVDLRFDPKAYVCTVGQPCATPALTPPTTVPAAIDSASGATSTN